MNPRYVRQRESSSSGGSLEVVLEATERKPNRAFALDETEAGATIDLLQELQGNVLVNFDSFTRVARMTDDSRIEVIRQQLSDYLRRLIARVSSRRTESDVYLDLDFSFEDRVIFGMSEESAKRLWDNDQDEIWNDL